MSDNTSPLKTTEMQNLSVSGFWKFLVFLFEPILKNEKIKTFLKVALLIVILVIILIITVRSIWF